MLALTLVSVSVGRNRLRVPNGLNHDLFHLFLPEERGQEEAEALSCTAVLYHRFGSC
jgi:hypothetical protein